MNAWFGIICVFSAGMLNGSYAIPLKKTPRWSFENTWLVYSVVAMLIVNWGIAVATVPQLGQVYARAGTMPVLMVFSFGLIWGLANLLFGAGISLIGMSLTFPICMGVSTALGSLVPMFRRPHEFLTAQGATIALGIAVLLAGVFIVALAGLRMDAQAKSSASAAGTASNGIREDALWKGLTIATLAGICDPFLNFAFTFGEGIKKEATIAGAAAGAESDAVWAIALMGSFFVNVLYCSMLLTRRGTWTKFHEAGTTSYWLLAVAMGIIWMVSITLYGRGASMMGPLGGSVGWAVFYSSIIIFSMLWGILCGEWREGHGRPLRTLYIGLAVLMAAVFILGFGNTLAASP